MNEKLISGKISICKEESNEKFRTEKCKYQKKEEKQTNEENNKKISLDRKYKMEMIEKSLNANKLVILSIL